MSGLCIAPRCLAPHTVGSVFCDVHALAPAGQRGGWLSAHAKKKKRGSGVAIDASNITRRLWIGGRPPFDRDLPGFDVLVLCAEELQPPNPSFHGRVVRAPIPDAMLSSCEMSRAIDGARAVGRSLLDGKTVLVTCAAGLNRSALVTALGLGMVTRMKPGEIIDLIRRRRSAHALNNHYFVKVINHLVIARRKIELPAR